MAPVHTETFSCVFVLFTVLKGIENNQLITWNNTKTQENVSVSTEPKPSIALRTDDVEIHVCLSLEFILAFPTKEN